MQRRIYGLSIGLAVALLAANWGCRSAADEEPAAGAAVEGETPAAEKATAPAMAPSPTKGPAHAKVTMFEISEFQ